MNNKLTLLALVYTAGLILIGMLRSFTVNLEGGELNNGVTVFFIIWTIFTVSRASAMGVDFNSFGFAVKPSPWLTLSTVLVALVILKNYGLFIQPAIATQLGIERDLSRFDPALLSIEGLLAIMLFSWIFAALGEEIAFRVILMKLYTESFDTSTNGVLCAVILQALVFGLVHSYQGMLGVIGASISGLVFGILIILGKGSIWPPLLAHGTNNSISFILLYTAS